MQPHDIYFHNLNVTLLLYIIITTLIAHLVRQNCSQWNWSAQLRSSEPAPRCAHPSLTLQLDVYFAQNPLAKWRSPE